MKITNKNPNAPPNCTKTLGNKVYPGGIAKVLKPKNEKNWMLIEVKRTGEAHWVPAWAVSKGYFRTLYEEEGVCQKGDLVEYLKGPLDGWCLVLLGCC